MNGIDDKSGIKAQVQGADNRSVEDDVEVLNEQGDFVSLRSHDEWVDADAEGEEGEEQTLEGLDRSPRFLKLKLPKPPAKKPALGTPPKPPVGTPPKPPVGTPPKPPVGTPPKPPVGTPPKPPVGTPPKPPVGTPPKPPVGAPPKPPGGTPPKPPGSTPPKPPTTAPTSGGTNTLSDIKRTVLESFVAPVLVAYTVNKITGERSLVHPPGSQPNANGSVTYPDGSVALTDGAVKHPDGGVTKPDGLYVYANGDSFNDATGVFTFADGVKVQAVKNNSGEWKFADAKDAGESKDAPAAPAEGAGKEPEASATVPTEVYTYENGDTFDQNTGVFTFYKGADVQYVRNDLGEWEYPVSK